MQSNNSAVKTKAQLIQAKYGVAIVAMLYAGFSHAQGLANVTTLVTNISAWLATTAVIVVTIAIMWCGYIMLFSRNNTSQIPYILGGGVIIGGAAQIASWIITGT